MLVRREPCKILWCFAERECRISDEEARFFWRGITSQFIHIVGTSFIVEVRRVFEIEEEEKRCTSCRD